MRLGHEPQSETSGHKGYPSIVVLFRIICPNAKPVIRDIEKCLNNDGTKG